MNAREIDGFIHSVREADAISKPGKADAPHTGGYDGEIKGILHFDAARRPAGLDHPK